MLNDFTATTLTGNPLIIKELLPKGACDSWLRQERIGAGKLVKRVAA
jgi:hypothetical protein